MEYIGPFYDYFINKHGIDVFNKIKNIILLKIKSFKYPVEKFMAKEEFYKIYVIYIFEIAVTDYWGMNDEQIEKYIKLTISEKIVSDFSIRRAKEIHSDAIKLIQSYLQKTTQEVQEGFKNE